MKIHRADLFFLGQDSLSNKENNKTIKRTFVQDSPCFKYHLVKVHHVQKWNGLRFTNPKIYIPHLWRSLRRGSSRCPLTAAWIQGNSTLWPMGKMHPCDPLRCFRKCLTDLESLNDLESEFQRTGQRVRIAWSEKAFLIFLSNWGHWHVLLGKEKKTKNISTALVGLELLLLEPWISGKLNEWLGNKIETTRPPGLG